MTIYTQSIWKLLDSYFNWSESNENDLDNFNYDPEMLAYIKNQIGISKPFSYSFFKPSDNINFDEYLEKREEAYNAYYEGKMVYANNHIQSAKKLYQDDPDLLRLEGIVLLSGGQFDDSIAVFNKLLSIVPDDFEGIRYRSVAYFEKKQLKNALEGYYKLYSKKAGNAEFLIFVAKSYIKINKLQKAKALAIKVRKDKVMGQEARCVLSHAYAKSRINLKKEIELYPDNNNLVHRYDLITSEILNCNTTYKIPIKKYVILFFMLIGIFICMATRIWTIFLFFFAIQYIVKLLSRK